MLLVLVVQVCKAESPVVEEATRKKICIMLVFMGCMRSGNKGGEISGAQCWGLKGNLEGKMVWNLPSTGF